MRATVAGLMALAVLAACGGGAAQPGGSTKITMTEFKFDPSTVNVSAGKVVLYLVNAGTVSHDMIISDSSGTRVAGSDLVSAGDQFVFTIDNLPAGSYTFQCNQPGHATAGMTGTLTVT